jgi:hypothetical protein
MMFAIEFRVLVDGIGREYDPVVPVDLQLDTLRLAIGTGDHSSVGSFLGEVKPYSSHPKRGDMRQECDHWQKYRHACSAKSKPPSSIIREDSDDKCLKLNRDHNAMLQRLIGP